MFAVHTYSEKFTEELKLCKWDVVDNGELTIVETDHVIGEDILGFKPEDLNKVFEYSKELKGGNKILIRGYIDPKTEICHMDSVTVDDGDTGRTYYRTQDVYGDGVGYLAAPSILNYLIADNYLTGIKVEQNRVIGKVGDMEYTDSADNLYCRDTITRWGFVTQIVFDQNEFCKEKFDSMKRPDITIADRMNAYSSAKSASIEVFLLDPIIGEFWKGIHVDEVTDLEKTTTDHVGHSVSKSYINSWTFPAVVRGKSNLLPLLDYILD